MKVSLGLPVHHVGADLATAEAIAVASKAAESGGFDAVYVTDHPMPTTRWLHGGGHPTLDPFVALSFASAATTTLRLHMNLLILAYRNPFLSAKGIATLDALSRGRLVVGVGAGYLRGEFEALGVSFDERNELTDEALEVMREAWKGEDLVAEGSHWRATGNLLMPVPAQRPGPPVWIGGNSKRAIRRSVELADGWMPMPSPAGSERSLKTPAITSVADLAQRIEYAWAHAAVVGRTAPLEIVFMPMGLDMFSKAGIDADAVVASVRELAEVGVTYLTMELPGSTLAEFVANIDDFSRDVLPLIDKV